MIDVLRETPAAARIAVLGEMLELGRAGEELHRQVGRYAAEHGINWLIGIRGQPARWWKRAVAAGLPRGRAHFFEDAAEAGEFARLTARPGDGGASSRVPAAVIGGAGDGEVPGLTPMLYYLLYERLQPIHQPATRLPPTPPSGRRSASLTALFLCIALGPWLINKLRQFQIGQYIREEGPKSTEEGRHTDHGRRSEFIISIV